MKQLADWRMRLSKPISSVMEPLHEHGAYRIVMTPLPRPPLAGLRRQLRSKTGRSHEPQDSFVRETFTLPRPEARSKAREWFARYPKAAYWTQVESWRALPGDEVEFTMRRLPTAD